MALIVKSRLARSSSILSHFTTSSGLLPSVYAPSLRRVVTSYLLAAPFAPAAVTVTVPNASPVCSALLGPKISNTLFESRSVARSMSLGDPPNRASLVLPPTSHAVPPACLMMRHMSHNPCSDWDSTHCTKFCLNNRFSLLLLVLVVVLVARGGLKGNGEDEDEDEEGVVERYRRRCCRGCHGRRFSAALTTRHHLLRHSNILLGILLSCCCWQGPLAAASSR